MTIALFGEAEKGSLDFICPCRTLEELFERYGEPPEDTSGLYFAVQTILYGMSVLYFRVKEEGVSVEDYTLGLKILRKAPLQALFLPGVGLSSVIEEGLDLCREKQGVLIIREVDFYDYMTAAT